MTVKNAKIQIAKNKIQRKEGQTVRTRKYIEMDASGSDWPVEQEGTLMADMGDGDWLVYVPGHGSPLVNECDFI